MSAFDHFGKHQIAQNTLSDAVANQLFSDTEINPSVEINPSIGARYTDSRSQSIAMQTVAASNDGFAAHQHNSESTTDMVSRLIASTAAGCVSRLALHAGGLHHIPKIGVPCAIAIPFILSGAVSSYEKTKSVTDPRSFAEGLLVYGGFSGMKHITGTINSHRAGLIEKASMTTPLPPNSYLSSILRSAK